MRIAFASETYLPHSSGVVTATRNLAYAFAERGHQVAVFTPSVNHEASIEMDGPVYVYRIPSVHNPFIKRTRMTVQQYPLVADALRNFKPDIAHLQSPWGVPISVLNTSRWQHFPVVATHHFSLEFLDRYLRAVALLHPFTRRAIMMFLNRIYSRCLFVTCPSEDIKIRLEHAGLKVPLRVLSNGVNTQWYTPAPQLQSKSVLLHVGRLDGEKNLELLAAALPVVFERTAASFLCVGIGSKKKWLEDQLKAWPGRVTFVGELTSNSPELRGYYQSATVFAVSSLVETQCLVALEAMSCGIPVVAADGGAMSSLIKDKITGRLVANNPEKYANALCELLENKDLREKISTTARTFVETNHNFSHTVSTLEKWYTQIIYEYATS